MRARNSASRRWFSSSSAVAAPGGPDGRGVGRPGIDDGGDPPPVAFDLRDHAISPSGSGAPLCVDVAVLVRDPEGEARAPGRRAWWRARRAGRPGREVGEPRHEPRMPREPARRPRGPGRRGTRTASPRRRERQGHEHLGLRRGVGDDEQRAWPLPRRTAAPGCAALTVRRPASERPAATRRAGAASSPRRSPPRTGPLRDPRWIDEQRVLGAGPGALGEHVGFAEEQPGTGASGTRT